MVFLVPSHFVLLEIRDPEVNAFLWDVKKLLMGTRDSRPVHLTIRGPYVGRVPRGVLARCRNVMRHDVLRIADVGRFRNPIEQVVFFRVDSPNLRKVWWKPHYPIKDGFTPHISVYRGADHGFADEVATLLRRQKVDLKCAEFSFSTRIAKQGSLLNSNPRQWRYALGDANRADPAALVKLQSFLAGAAAGPGVWIAGE